MGQEQIKSEIRRFYMELMGKAADRLDMVDKRIVDLGPKLSRNHKLLLITECTADEVRDALFSMDSHKAPGIDGYNAYFYKKCWHIVGEEITSAVQQFFHTSSLPAELNVALISSIPKCENACQVKDFRPIACCTVLYKIISKILANRLQPVLESVVSSNQSAFVKGRLIFDKAMS